MNPLILTGEGTNATVTAVTNAATSVQTEALAMIQGVVPIAAVVLAAVVSVSLGWKLIRRFMKG